MYSVGEVLVLEAEKPGFISQRGLLNTRALCWSLLVCKMDVRPCWGARGLAVRYLTPAWGSVYSSNYSERAGECQSSRMNRA